MRSLGNSYMRWMQRLLGEREAEIDGTVGRIDGSKAEQKAE